MRRTWFAIAALGISELACAGRPTPAVTGAAREIPNQQPRTAPPRATAPQVPRPLWNEAYARACRGSITLPVVSASGQWLVYCDGVFEAETGQYVGPARLGVDAFLTDTEVVATNYSGGGIDRGSVLARNPDRAKQALGGFVLELATNFDRSRIVGIEESQNHTYRAVVRFAPDFTANISVDVPTQDYFNPGHLWFFPDGRAVIRIGSALSELAPSGLQQLGPPYENMSRIAVTENGESAVITWRDGSRAVVTTRTGVRAYTLPRVSNESELEAPLALDANAHRVAFVSGGQLTIAELDVAPRIVHEERASDVKALQFTRDGRALLVDDSDLVHVLREGEPLHAKPAPTYPVTPPEGFVGAEYRDHSLSFRGFESEEMSVPPGLLAWYRHPKRGVEVMITATDATEFGAPARPLDDWAASIVARQGDVPEPKSEHVWATPDGRQLEYVYFQREGCDPHDRYVRFVERGPWLYSIVIQFPPGSGFSRVKPLLSHFFDVPSGEPKEARAALKSAPVGEPC